MMEILGHIQLISGLWVGEAGEGLTQLKDSSDVGGIKYTTCSHERDQSPLGKSLLSVTCQLSRIDPPQEGRQ